MEQMRYYLLFHWFVGLAIDDTVWDHSVFSKNRERWLDHEVVEAFFTDVMSVADKEGRAVAGAVGADKAYDTSDFVRDCGARSMMPPRQHAAPPKYVAHRVFGDRLHLQPLENIALVIATRRFSTAC